MVISQLKTVKENSSSFCKAQEKAMEDVEKWALKEENRAIQDCSQKLNEIFVLWADAQHQFVECVEELRHNFKMILEGGLRNIDLCVYSGPWIIYIYKIFVMEMINYN